MNTEATNLSEKKDFLVRSSSLKDVRSFSREVFEKFNIDENLREELVLAIAEAAQNIVKHAYKDYPDTQDRMAVRISCTDKELEIAFFDKSEVLLMENAGAEQDTSTHRNTITIRETQSQDFFLVCLKLIDYDIDLKIDVYNLVAKKVQHVYDGPAVKSEDCPDKYKIEAYNLPNGMYICIVQGKNLKLSGKFVISR